jgi:hypothetical protein
MVRYMTQDKHRSHKKKQIEQDDMVQVHDATGLFARYNGSVGRVCVIDDSKVHIRYLDGDISVPIGFTRKIHNAYMTTMLGGNKKQ